MKVRQNVDLVGFGLARFSFWIFVSYFAALVLMVAICANTIAVSADATDTISINVSAACTLNATNTTHTATVTPGQWTPDIGQSNLTAVCNDSGGYAIYAIGYTNNEYGNTNLINTTDQTQTIVTGPNKSGNTSNWSMKLGKGTGESATIEGETSGDTEDFYTDYHIIPSTYTKVAKKTDATSSSSSGTSLTTTYGVFTTTTQIAGVYEGQVKYILLHPGSLVAGNYNINYYANGGSGTMEGETGVHNYEEHTLRENSFVAPNEYGFVGWCTTQDTSVSLQTTCAGTFYQDGGKVPISTVTANDTLNLYAVWKEVITFDKAYLRDGKVKQDGYYAIQDMNSSICAAVDVGQVGQLIDMRDDEVYHVGKLMDNKCWTLDNLRLDPTDSAVKTKLTSVTTNASDATLDYLKGNTTGTTADKYATSAVANWFSNYSYSNPLINANYKNDTSVNDSLSDEAKTWEYGIYYNYCAASAGSYCYGNDMSSGTSSGDAAEDLCSIGWRMPNINEYSVLYDDEKYGTLAAYRTALHLPFSGFYNDGFASYRGSRGHFWSSVRNDDYGMRSLNIDANGVDVTSFATRYSGLAIRCVSD